MRPNPFIPTRTDIIRSTVRVPADERSSGKFQQADFLHSALNSETFKRLYREAGKDFDAMLDFLVNTQEKSALRVVRSSESYRIADTPMRAYWLSRPGWTDF